MISPLDKAAIVMQVQRTGSLYSVLRAFRAEGIRSMWQGAGFANIYFERTLKEAECEFDESCDIANAQQAPLSLWLRNVQLGLFSVPQAALLLFVSKGSRQLIATHGALAGFTPAVWLATVLMALGGLLIATVVKYADNLIKTFATASSIVLTCAITAVATGVAPTLRFVQGMGLVFASMFLYNSQVGLRAAQPEAAAEE